ncbi:MAG: lipopolysaccharide assembly protein LapA domain-containing protein [Acidimicrobiales bacterium]
MESIRRSNAQGGGRLRRWLSPKVVVGGALGLLALVFIFQNTARGRVEFLFWDFEAPAWLWLLVIFVAGVVVGSIWPWFRRRRG